VGGRHRPELHNRVPILLMHGTRYAFHGPARLAADVGCSRATIWRLMTGRTRPSFALAQAVADALAADLGQPLPPREVFSSDGTYPTRSGCVVSGCEGCFPDEAYDRHGNLRPIFWYQRPGDWSLAPAGPCGPQGPDTHSPTR
jgi:transcriptional regulator with XRE-family HTH domain